MSTMILFNNNLKKISNCRSLPVLSLASFSPKSLHLPSPYKWLSDFFNPHRSFKFQGHSFTIWYILLLHWIIHYTSTFKYRTLHIQKECNLKRVMYSCCLLFTSHSCPLLFSGFFPHLSNIQLQWITFSSFIKAFLHDLFATKNSDFLLVHWLPPLTFIPDSSPTLS